ncbi:hypothetical protein [Paenibacillus sp. FSL M7-0896]|uniref:hypothetical protein n=1 Tax=Paenibacillus sp. FSL M7-0896 TaxID=2921610 RepID=UPI0030D7F2D2
MKILAVKQEGRTGEDSDFRELDLIEEINAITLSQRSSNSAKILAFDTNDGTYLPLTTLADIAKICGHYGYEMMGDAVVNTRKIAKTETVRNNGSIVTFIGGRRIKVKKQV